MSWWLSTTIRFADDHLSDQKPEKGLPRRSLWSPCITHQASGIIIPEHLIGMSYVPHGEMAFGETDDCLFVQLVSQLKILDLQDF